MCMVVRTSMLIGLALTRKRCVCRERLLQKSEALMSIDRDIIADISFSSIRKVVGYHSETLSVRVSNGSFGVCRKRPVTSDRIFDCNFQKRCYSSSYTPDDYNRIEQVLSGEK